MLYSQSTILSAVKAVIDENLSAPAADALSGTLSDALSDDLEQTSMNDIILANVPDAVAMVEKAAPIWMVEGLPLFDNETGLDTSGQPITWHEIGTRNSHSESSISLISPISPTSPTTTTTPEPSNPDLAWWGSIAMPADFMRLLLFEMSDWDYPVSDPITDQDARYARQRSPFRGVRGNPNRPVVALHNSRIEFYCCLSKEATITSAQYAPWPKWADTDISIPPRLYTAAIYQTAALTLQQLGMSETAKDLSTLVPMLI